MSDNPRYPMDAHRPAARGGDPGTLLICPNRAMAEELLDLLRRESPLGKAVDWKAYPDSRELDQLASTASPGACFLDMETDPERAFRILAQNLGASARMPMVALIEEKNPDLILRCLRQGAGAFLLRPFSAGQLRLALDKVLDPSAAIKSSPEPLGSVVCVVPAKGGCGATTISVNLACQSSHLHKIKVLLADMDPLTSPLSFLLKLRSQYSFMDALLHSNQMDDGLWKALVTSYQGIDVLLAPESPADSSLETQDPKALLDYVRRNYRLVILDAGWPYGNWNARLAALSDEVMVVVTSDVTSLFAAQRAITYLEEKGVERSSIRLVVNQYWKHAGLEPKDIAKALGLPVYQLVPRDDQAIGNAQMDGRPATADSRFSKSLAELAARLHGKEPEPSRHSPRTGPLSHFRR